MGPYLEAGEAIVAADGIRYLGRTYTLALAIRQQWFKQAREQGPWKVSIFGDMQTLRLYLKHEEAYHSCEPFAPIDRETENIHMEIRKFSQLKESLRQLKTGNKQAIYFPGKRTNR